MNLKIYELTRILLDTKVRKVIAEDFNGYFGLLPRHIDFITGLVPGILTYEDKDGNVRYAAINEGVLVKAGPDVSVSTSHAVLGNDLPELEDLLQRDFLIEDERERKVRTAAARLEADLARRFMRFGRQYHA
ncbi:MAG TPA: F0F1 ATP synthase subunit epsilon [Deltaproteobacteria bacterium]|jgi:F-type H+-transporting ATPase subunit epsilon|nr:F0F1 ATP synthase subunit epsilon [Deltaproteobacteria bacterium]HQI00261.1 F0F1 ATP synthase subunit epsilon [Deltaproteobacteria bacterium]HQJ07938.1 F0F1 ATP synthase subunit epsilon [Deltaproteobacteria bacterium]